MKNEFVAWGFSFMLRNRTAEGNITSWVHCHNHQCSWRRRCTFISCMNITKLSVSTSHPRGNHGWRFTARTQISGGMCNRASIGAQIIWLVETRYFSLGEQFYSTAGVNWTRMAKELFVRSCYRNGSLRLGLQWAIFQSPGKIWFFKATQEFVFFGDKNQQISGSVNSFRF